eukprot:93307-Chlamydomonas_euryale.AAC.11
MWDGGGGVGPVHRRCMLAASKGFSRSRGLLGRPAMAQREHKHAAFKGSVAACVCVPLPPLDCVCPLALMLRALVCAVWVGERGGEARRWLRCCSGVR